MDLQEIEKLIDNFDEIIFENNSDIYDEYSDFDDLLFEINQRIIIHRDFFYHEENGDKEFSNEFKAYIALAGRLVAIIDELQVFDPEDNYKELRQISRMEYYDLEDLEENYLDEYDEEDMVNNMFPNRNNRADEDSFDDGFDLDKHFGLD